MLSDERFLRTAF